MIYKEYFVSPSIFCDFDQVRFIRNTFSNDKGLMISTGSRDKWLSDSRKAVKNSELSPRKKKEVLHYISRIQKSGVIRSDSVINSKQENYSSWVDRYVELLKHDMTDGAIVDRVNHRECVWAITDLLEDQLEENTLFSVPPSKQSNGDPESIANFFSISVARSNIIYLCDPYFVSNSRECLDYLERLIKCISNKYEIPLKKKMVICSRPESPLSISKFERSLDSIRKANTHLHLELKTFHDLHDRFLLTEFIGFNLGHGFAPGHNNKLNIFRLSFEDLRTQHLKLDFPSDKISVVR